MASLDDNKTANAVHALNIGHNGSGKTGALISLAQAGYKIRVLDFDGGAEILKQLLTDKDGKKLPGYENIDVETYIDKYAPQQGTGAMRPIPTCNAFEKAMTCLTNWPGFGSPMTWGTDTVLVIDTLTSSGRAAMNHVAKMKGKLTSIKKEDLHPSQPDWGDAMGLQENLMAMLSSLPCHVIVNSHVTFVTRDGEMADEGFPSALGSKLPPKIGGYFNSILYTTKEGMGQNKKRVIQTKSSSLVQTKTSAPGKVKDSYPLETGLADYFRDLHGPLKIA